MTDRIEVCPAAELSPGERRIVDAGPFSIGVFNVDGDYVALQNTCQHQYGPICEGTLVPAIEAEYQEPGIRVEERVAADTTVIRCPWHGWTYDLETGVHTGDEDIAIPTFDVVEDDGVLYVEP